MKLNTCSTLLTLFLLAASTINAQENKNIWNGKKCAVVLTYDDGTDFHLDNVIPVLDSLNLKATFYIPGSSKALYSRMDEWRAAAKEGHELGNHTIFHPCHGKSMGRKWVNPDYDLDDYSINRFMDEIRVNNTLLKAIDGKDMRTFAYTCGDTSIGDSSFVPLLKKYVIAARSTKPGLNYLNDVDLFGIKNYGVRKQSVEELIKLVEKAKKENAMIVFLFHGVGGGAPYSISTEDHSKFVHYLKEHESDMWITPMVNIAEFIKKKRQE